jgi:cytochrome c-type biogenesis protein CcmH
VIAFVVSAALLTLVAVGFLLWPLWSRGHARGIDAVDVDRRNENVAAYRERLDELRAELAAGTIDADAYEGLEEELGASLLADAGPDAPAPVAQVEAAPGPVARRTLWTAAAVLPLVAIWGYVQVGALPDVLLRDSAQALLSGQEAGEGDMRVLVARLERRLAREPDDSQGWYLLGHGRLHLQEYRAAAEAFEQLHRRTGDDVNVMVSLAQAHFLADHGRISEPNRTLMLRVLSLSPTQPLVLEMLAIDAFNRQDFEAAASYLERALSGSVTGARAADLREGLSQARALAGTASAPVQPEVGNGARIGVRVTLADQVVAAAGARIFVFAREPGGPPVPIAVRALRLAELPADFYLTDADAMQAGRTLSDFDRIELVARLSQSGDVVFRDGDLEARSGPVDPRDSARISLTIGP